MEEGAREEGLLVVAVTAVRTEAPEVWVSMTAATLWTSPREGSLSVCTVAALAGEEVMCAAKTDRPKIVVDLLVPFPA